MINAPQHRPVLEVSISKSGVIKTRLEINSQWHSHHFLEPKLAALVTISITCTQTPIALLMVTTLLKVDDRPLLLLCHKNNIFIFRHKITNLLVE